jgi:hypothetical protein
VLLPTGADTRSSTVADLIQSESNPDRIVDDHDEHESAVRIYVDVNALPDGDGTRRAPFQTITDGLTRAREIRHSVRNRIIILVAPGTYTENYPLYVNVSNLELRGSTRLILDDKGLPEDCGVTGDSSPCMEAGTETLITPENVLPNGRPLFMVAPTRDMSEAKLHDIKIRGFVFDGLSNVGLSGLGMFIDRVTNFLVERNVIRHGGPGINTRLSSGTMKSNFAYHNVDGLAASGGSQLEPADVILLANRSTHNGTGAIVLGTAGVKAYNDDLNLKEIQTLFDPSMHPEQVPDALVITVDRNDFSDNAMFGFRFEEYVTGSFFYDTTDNQAMTANISAMVRHNTCRNNLEYGFLVEGAFAPRSNPRRFTAVFDGTFRDNDLSGQARAGLFVGFMLNGQVTRNPALINTTQYLQDSVFRLRVAPEDGSYGIDYDNPILDRFDGITSLHNVLRINRESITGTHVTCPTGFPCNP